MKRILFVDDEPKVLEDLQRMLRTYRHEWEMAFVASAAEALEALAAQNFAVIVSDVRIPGLDGIQLLERVQKDFPSVIRVVLSGYFERDAVLRAAGVAHQYLAKPCDPAKLYETVNNLCRSNAILTNEAARGVVNAMGSLPSPPQTYASLKEALQQPDASLKEVGRIIEQDVGMTAKVLQLVNSPLFGLICEISNVHTALGYIGLPALRELALSVEIFQAFEPERHFEGFSLTEFQTHCRLTAKIAARLPAEEAVVQVAVIAALLHDTGKLVLAARLPGTFQLALRKSLKEKRPLYVVEEEVIGISHAEIGAYLLSLWGLPKSIVDAVRNHHRPSAAPHCTTGLDVLAITHIADALAAEFDSRVSTDAPPTGRWDLQYLDRLGLTNQIPAWRRIAREVASPVGA
jgi:putative nucleotidyltransferase with HDIG domain